MQNGDHSVNELTSSLCKSQFSSAKKRQSLAEFQLTLALSVCVCVCVYTASVGLNGRSAYVPPHLRKAQK